MTGLSRPEERALVSALRAARVWRGQSVSTPDLLSLWWAWVADSPAHTHAWHPTGPGSGERRQSPPRVVRTGCTSIAKRCPGLAHYAYPRSPHDPTSLILKKVFPLGGLRQNLRRECPACNRRCIRHRQSLATGGSVDTLHLPIARI